MNRIAPCCILLLFFSVEVRSGEPPRKTGERLEAAEFERLSGAFAVTRFEFDGKAATADELKSMRVDRAKDRWTHVRGKTEVAFADRIDPAKNPATIDITATSGADKDDTFPGIYEVKDGVVRLCFSKPGAPRADKFEAKKGSGRTLIELRRFRPPTVRVTKVLPEWPVPGGRLKLVVQVTDPEEGKCHVEFTTADGSSKSVFGSSAEVEVNDLTEGESTFTLRGVSDRGGVSAAIKHTVEVKAPKLASPPAKPEIITNSIGMKFVKVPAGEFAMGSGAKDEGEAIEEPQHGVRIPNAYHLGQYEITVGDYVKLYQVRPKLENFLYASPQDVEAWIEATPSKLERFCQALSDLPAERAAGRTYRLPTEEEWEYACRAGTTTRFSTGNILRDSDARFGESQSGVGVYRPNRVGAGRANPFGFYDMHGNVNELCLSRGNYWTASADLTATKRSDLVIRGGSATSEAKQCASAARSLADPKRIKDYIGGARLVCEFGKPRPPEGKALGDSLAGWTGATALWTAKDGSLLTGSLTGRIDAAMYSRERIGDFTASFDLKVTGAALFGLRFRGAVTNPTKDITDGPMFLFAGPGRTEDDDERYAWFTIMGRPQSIWASSPEKKNVIGQLVKPGKSNSIVITVRGKKVTAKLQDEVVWDGEVRDMLGEGVIGLVVVSSKGGEVELKNFKVRNGNQPDESKKDGGSDVPAAKNFKPNGSVMYRNSAAPKANVIEQRAIGVVIGEKEPVTAADEKTVTGYRIEFVRADDRTPLGTFTVARDKWVYWGGKGGSHTMDPSAWRPGDRFAVIINADLKASTIRLESIFGAGSFTPDK